MLIAIFIVLVLILCGTCPGFAKNIGVWLLFMAGFLLYTINSH